MNDDLLSEFVTESTEHISDIEPLLLEMETSGLPTMDQMNQIFRAIHSIKGAAGFLGLADIARLSHSGENLLMLLRDGDLEFDVAMADPLLSFVDELRKMLEALPEESEEFPEALLLVIEGLASGTAAEVAAASAPAEAHEEAKEAPAEEEIASAPEGLDEPEAATPLQPAAQTEAEQASRLYFGEIAIDLGLLSTDQLDQVLDAQANESGKRTRIGQLAQQLGFLDPEAVENVLEEQVIRRAMAGQKAAVSEIQAASPAVQSKAPEATAAGEKNEASESKAAGEKNETSESKAAVEKKEASESKDAGEAKEAKARIKTESRNETIRVNVGLLDELMNLAGELVLGRNQLVQALDTIEVPGLKRVLQGIDLVTSDLQEHIMHTRMQPLSVVFDRLPRMIRDISKKVDKDADLVLEGKEVELDRSILESLRDPMTHLIRNSMDHGLETKEERAQTDKPARGTISVKAFHQGGQIIVEIADDGRGIDPDKLRRVAHERGLYDKETAEHLSDKEAIYLIFHPGLSTAKQVTSISGRGVGMDVVRSNIQQLGGQIDLESTVGSGTVIRIRLPLTLAIITSLTVSVGEERYVLPQVNLAEILRMAPEELEAKVETLMDVEVMRIRNQLLPIIRLSDVLGIPAAEDSPDVSVVVLRTGEQEYGLVVDGLHDNEEIVVKPLSSFLSNCKWFAGATILGDGTVAMILDANGLSAHAGMNFDELQAELNRLEHNGSGQNASDTRSLILFGNGAEEQFALPLREVRRLERIRMEEIEYVGQSEFIQHRGSSIPLLRLEDFLNVAHPGTESESLFVIIPNTDGDDVGIVATRIIDTVTSDLIPEEGLIRQPGLLGSNILNGKMTLFLNTSELLDASGLQQPA